MRESLKFSTRFERACLIRLPHRELHRGQRPIPAAMKAGHMTATDPSTKSVQQHLDPQGPSTHEIVDQVRASEAGRRLTRIPGVGPITAGALLAMVPDPAGFRSARHFATWLGLAPRQNSSGGKQRLGRISKQGNRYLRTLLILGAANVLRFMRKNTAVSAWLAALRERRPFKVVAVALAHKMARIVWALMVKGGVYRAAVPAAAAS